MTDQTVHRDAKNEAANRWAGLILNKTVRSGTDPRPPLDRKALARLVAGMTGASMAHVTEYADANDWARDGFEMPDLSKTPLITPDFPTQGRFLVAAWQWAYALLSAATGRVDLKSLAQVLVALTDISQDSAENLLHRAAREGLLERDRHNVGGRSRTTVYLKDVYR
jgi:hypothetical protein